MSPAVFLLSHIHSHSCVVVCLLYQDRKGNKLTAKIKYTTPKLSVSAVTHKHSNQDFFSIYFIKKCLHKAPTKEQKLFHWTDRCIAFNQSLLVIKEDKHRKNELVQRKGVICFNKYQFHLQTDCFLLNSN